MNLLNIDKKLQPVKTPIVIQMENVECGAAALGIILSYYGKYISLDELRTVCKVTREGTKALHMVEAARHYGLQAQGAKVLNIQDLKTLSPPFIAFWEFNHFVVIEGLKKDKIYINDPARGRYVIDEKQFDTSFTGVILLFSAGKNFKKDKRRPNFWLQYFLELRHSADGLVYIGFVSLFLILPGVIIPGFSKIFIDDILIKQYTGWFIPLLWGLALTGVLRGVLFYLQQIFLLKLNVKVLFLFSVRFVNTILKLPMAFFNHRYSGDLLERVSANDRIASFLTNELSTDFVNLLSSVFFAVILLLLSWPLALVSFFLIFLNIFVVTILGPKIQSLSYRYMRDISKLDALEINILSISEALKACSLEKASQKLLSSQYTDVVNAQQNLILSSRYFMNIPNALDMLSSIVILCLGALLIIKGHLSAGTLIAFQSIQMSFQAPIKSVLSFFESFQKIQADLARQQDVYKYPKDPNADMALDKLKVPEKTEKIYGPIQISDVTFTYTDLETPTLKDISLLIEPSQSMAFIGISGSGKSSLLKLILGLLKPNQGSITLNNQHISEIHPFLYAQSIGYADQQPYIIEGSVEDNLLLYAQNKPTSEDMLDVLKRVNLYDDLMERKGLHTHLIEGGMNLSLGQCQRIEIARALLRNPSILIFDEATSALDRDIEAKIIHSILKTNITFLVASHRQDIFKKCDQILALEKGQIRGIGSHKSLLVQSPYYRELIQTESPDA